jgi:hypothetical protein
MLRLFGRNLILNKKCPELLTRAQNIRFIAVSSKHNSSSNFQSGSSNANESSNRDPEKVKRAKLLDVLIVSSIGIIGFGYLIVRRAFSGQVHAKSADGLTQELGNVVEKELEPDAVGGETQIQRKKRKTFKETRVGSGKGASLHLPPSSID